jgi:DNA polymerase III subunit delta'
MSWEHIRGHRSAVQSFRTAFTRGRLGQAYLLVGPEGVGKHLFARELAKSLLCERPPLTLVACDRCPSCAQVAAGTHPDVFSLATPKDKQEIPVDEMRNFCTQMALKPSRGSRKVGIVLDADDFNEESANAFLKTLEEPPPGSLMILLTTSLDRQLPTIQSRCQVVRFSSLRTDDVRAVLTANGVTDPVRVARLIRLGCGSPGVAMALNDEDLWEFRRNIIAELTAESVDVAGLAGTWENFYKKGGKELVKQRPRVSLVIRFVVEYLQLALRLALGVDASAVDGTEEASLRVFAEKTGTDGLLDLIDRCVEADYRVERNVQLILIVESLLDSFAKWARAGGATTAGR